MADFYQEAAQKRAEQLAADHAECLADIARAKAYSDLDSAGSAVQRLADIQAQQQALAQLHQNYIRSITPPQPRQISDEERMRKPIEDMDLTDTVALMRTSKYGRDLDENDPNFRAGIQDVINRRQRGQ